MPGPPDIKHREIRGDAAKIKWPLVKAQVILSPESDFYCTPPPDGGMGRTRDRPALILHLAGSTVMPPSGFRHGATNVQLLFLLLLLVAPYLILTPAGRWIHGLRLAPPARARVGLTLFFLFTALGHFVRAEEMAEMVPPPIPYRLGLIYVTGVLELLGAAGVWVPRLKRLTGVCLILMLIGFLPANIYSAVRRVDFGGHAAGPAYLLLRVPFQLFVIWWTYFATEQRWLRRQPEGA